MTPNTGHSDHKESAMSQTIVTYTVKPGLEEENAALVRAVFDELAKNRPAGFRYAVFQAAEHRERPQRPWERRGRAG